MLLFFLIIREILLLIGILLLTTQSSSLWRRIIIVPSRILGIFVASSYLINSGIFMVIYVMTFIGGLLVLLVRVARINFQEQGRRRLFLVEVLWSLFYLPLFLECKSFFLNSNELVSRASWLTFQSNYFVLMVSFFSFSLIFMSLLIQTFKGLIRSL